MIALCIGEVSYNIEALCSEFPTENTKNKFEKLEYCPGGSAADMAYLLVKYGFDTYLGSATGDDTYASIIKKRLEKAGVHTEYMETVFEKKTASSFIIIGQKNNSRTVYDLSSEPLFLKKTEFQINPDLVISDGYDYNATLAAFNHYKDKTLVLSANMYNREIIELCKYTKYIIASKEFAETITSTRINFENPQSLVTVYSTLVNKFPGRNIIVTLEEKGAMYMENNQIKVMPGLNLKVVDSSGSGNMFRAAFGYALVKGYDIEKAITFANIAGGLTVTKVGTIEACPELSEVMHYYIQKYPENPAPQNNAAPTVNVSPAPNPESNPIVNNTTPASNSAPVNNPGGANNPPVA